MSEEIIYLVISGYFVGGLITILTIMRLAGWPDSQGAMMGYAYGGAMWPVYWLLVLLIWPRGKE